MRRLAILTAPLAAAVILLAAPSAASAATCSTAPVGGEKAPTVDPVASTVSETGEQGYKCTVAWQAGLFVRYESGGTWHGASETAPAFHPDAPDSFWPAATYFEWPLLNRQATDADWTWTPTAAGDTPVCAFNWKIEVDFYSSNVDGTGLHPVFLATSSAETHKTC